MMPTGLIFEPAEYRGSAQQMVTFRLDMNMHDNQLRGFKLRATLSEVRGD